MFSSSRFNLDDFCIVYKSKNLQTNVHKKSVICHSQRPAHLQSQIIAVTILNNPYGMAQCTLVIVDQLVLVLWLPRAYRANRWQPTALRPRGSGGSLHAAKVAPFRSERITTIWCRY